MAILRKDNPRNKNYHFSYIAVCHVLSEVSSSVNPKLSTLNQTLALRFIQASVDQTKSDPVMASAFLLHVCVRAYKYLSSFFDPSLF
jgi:hypothetical protein